MHNGSVFVSLLGISDVKNTQLETTWKKARGAYDKESFGDSLQFTNLCIDSLRNEDDLLDRLALENNKLLCEILMEKNANNDPFDQLRSQIHRELANSNHSNFKTHNQQ
jgi:hypothetical protein